MISDPQRKQLLALMQTPQWRVIEEIADELKTVIGSEERETESEWEFVRHHLKKEGQIKGINRLLETFYNEARNV